MSKQGPKAVLYDENNVPLTGSKVSAGSIPVVIASDQANVNVALPAYSQTLFGGILAAAPLSLADIVNKYYIDPTVWGTSLVGAGTTTFIANQSAISVAVGTANADRARLRTHTYYHYQSGKSQAMLITGFNSNAGNANQTRRWGYFEDQNGLFFQLTATTLAIVRRTFTSGSVVDNAVDQASWNGDKLNGTGASGITLDITKANIYEIRFQWLGAGTVQYWINGILVHTIANANTLAVPYMTIGQLPIQVETINTGASTAGGFTVICATVRSDGGAVVPDFSFAAYNAANITVGTTEIPLLSIRQKATFQGLANRVITIPKLLSVSTEGARAAIKIVLNGALTGASYASADADSAMEFDVAATVITGGSTLFRGFLPNTNEQLITILSDIFNTLGRTLKRNAFDTTGDVLTITGVNEATGNTLMRASLSWGEVR